MAKNYAIQNSFDSGSIIAENAQSITKNAGNSIEKPAASANNAEFVIEKPENQALEWVNTHLPDLQPGEFYCWSKRSMDANRKDWERKDYTFLNHFCTDRAVLVEQVLSATKDTDTDVFVSPASFSRRERKNSFVVQRRAIAFDFDVATPVDSPASTAEKYPRIKEAAEAAFELGAKLGVKMTFVKSGRGVHTYIRLDKDYPAEEVKALADKLKNWARAEGLKIDASVTGDMSRLMRMPGSFWRKNKAGLKVVLGDVGDPVSLDELNESLGQVRKASESLAKPRLIGQAGIVANGPDKHYALDAVTANLAGHNEPFSISENKDAILSALAAMNPDSEDDWRWALKLYKGARELTGATEEELAWLWKEAVMPWSHRSGKFESEDQQREKMSTQQAVHPRVFLKHVADNCNWRNPGKDSSVVHLSGGDIEKTRAQLLELNGQRVRATLGLVMAAIGCPEIAGVRLAFDTFTGEASVSKVEEETWRKITDADVIELRVRLEEKCFKTVSAEMARDAMKGLLGRNRVDTAKTWANGLPAWDGVERISRFLVEYFQSEDTPYALSVGKYLWTALAGRLLQPGIKCDMVPIFVGDQGKRKSSGVLAMCPNPEAFTELSFHGNDDDTKRLLRGRLVIELAELAGMAKRDAEALKSFISARFDEWRPNYHEGMARYYRRGIFIGTSNRDDFLKDSTGHRRFLPINVGSVDVEAIERDRDQLWAEAIVMFNKNGVLYAAAEHAAKDEHAKFEQENPLAEKLEHLLKTGPFPIGGRQLWDEPYLKLASVMQLLAIEPKDMNRMRPEVANALQVLGYKKIRRRLSSGSNPASAWARASGTVHTP